MCVSMCACVRVCVCVSICVLCMYIPVNSMMGAGEDETALLGPIEFIAVTSTS